ncbi:hypothetical protein ACVBEH_25750, partial [Roseateles sp. GG27B]
MFNDSLNLSHIGDLLALVVYSAFALSFGNRLLRQSGFANAVSTVFVAALVASSLWAGLGLASALHILPVWLETFGMPLADQLRYGLWFCFVLLLLRPVEKNKRGSGDPRLFMPIA